MPALLEPNKQFPIVLESDRSKPVAEQPTFYALSKSMRESEKLDAEFDAIFENPGDTPEMHRRICEMLHTYIVGWKNMGDWAFPSSADGWRGLLLFHEAVELLRKVMRNQAVQAEEKKS